jgi:predicted DNA-binding transcriptional regulator YafY
MRADRLVSLVLLLRQRGRLTAETLAQELEVSTRTVLRDIEALSSSGVPVYAERGRHGGFALLPGFRTELTGLNRDEAVALLAAGTARGGQMFGLGAAFASAVRKVVDALPESNLAAARNSAQRLLVEPGITLLPDRTITPEATDPIMAVVRRAVLAGHRLRLHYQAADRAPQWRTVDPLGLVTAQDRGYLMALRDGADRIYRLSRILAVEELDEPADRPDQVDLDTLWRDRCAQFLSQDHLTVLVLVDPARREELTATAVAVRAEEPEQDGTLRLEVTYQDTRHAEWALWQLAGDAEVLAPQTLRDLLRDRARIMAERYLPW